jgi:outer membrane protein assembly factor BamB
VVAGGRVFFSDERGFGAYNAATGVKLWSVRYAEPDEQGVSAFAVSGTTLLVAEVDECKSASDQNGTLTAYNVASGAVLWSAFREEPMFTITVDKGVVVGTGDDGAGPAATAYRVSDGQLLWEKQGADAEVVASAGGRVLLTLDSGDEAQAVDIVTGVAAWTMPDPWLPQAATPDGKRFLVRTLAGALAEVNASDGSVAWSQPDAGGRVAVDNTQVYAVHNGTLTAYATGNGAPHWSTSVGALLGGYVPRPVVAGGIVYYINGQIDAVNSATGVVFDNELFGSEFDHAVAENGRLYVTNGRVLDMFAP